jgi:hypothetical protein
MLSLRAPHARTPTAAPLVPHNLIVSGPDDQGGEAPAIQIGKRSGLRMYVHAAFAEKDPNVIAQRTRRTHAPPPRRVARARMAVHRSVAATTLAVPRPSGYCSACGAYRPVIADTMRMTVRAAADELTRRKMAPLRHGTRSSDIVRAGIFTQGCAGADQEDWVTEPRMSGTRSLGQTRISLCGGPSGISGWIVYHGVTRPLLRYFGLERLTTPLELDSRDSAPLQWHNT